MILCEWLINTIDFCVTWLTVYFSVRWKILLGFSCRNRLLLTGTPIQNSMAEVTTSKTIIYSLQICLQTN